MNKSNPNLTIPTRRMAELAEPQLTEWANSQIPNFPNKQNCRITLPNVC